VEHVVFYPGPDGGPVFRRVGSLDEAVGLVERLRNDEDLAEFSVYSLTQIPLSVRTYYKIEVPASVRTAEPAQPVRAAEPEAVAGLPPAAPVVPSQSRGEADQAVAGTTVAGESDLGFFTH